MPRQKGEAAAAGLAERTSLSRWLLFAPSFSAQLAEAGRRRVVRRRRRRAAAERQELLGAETCTCFGNKSPLRAPFQSI